MAVPSCTVGEKTQMGPATARSARFPRACPSAKPIDLRRGTHTATILVSTQAEAEIIETHTHVTHYNRE